MRQNTYITGRQSQEMIYQCVIKENELHGISPTIQEIAYQLNMSITNVVYHLGALERQGKIQRKRYKARSIKIIKE